VVVAAEGLGVQNLSSGAQCPGERARVRVVSMQVRAEPREHVPLRVRTGDPRYGGREGSSLQDALGLAEQVDDQALALRFEFNSGPPQPPDTHVCPPSPFRTIVR
jgi:hypothetical protein